MNYEINNHQEIKDSLIDSFKSQYGSKRSDIVKGATEMKKQLGKAKDSISKEYLGILDEIIKEYSKKQTIQELEDSYTKSKFSKNK